MDQAITKLLFIGVAIAMAAIVVGVAWTSLNDNTPSDINTVEFKRVTTQALCTAAGGTWTAANTVKCGP